jgi:hypothetical protein
VLLHRLIKRRREAPRLAYLPCLLVTGLFALSALADERRDLTALLGLLPLAIVVGQVMYPTVIGWAVLWVPATLASMILALWPEENTTMLAYVTNIVLLLAPAVSVMIFPPRIRQGASQLRFIAAALVGATFVVIALGLMALNPRIQRRPPPRRTGLHEMKRPGDRSIAWPHVNELNRRGEG